VIPFLRQLCVFGAAFRHQTASFVRQTWKRIRPSVYITFHFSDTPKQAVLIVSLPKKKMHSYLENEEKKSEFHDMYAGVVVSKNAGVIDVFSSA
jgi:hypothetical protein